MKRNAVVRLELPSEKLVQIILKALLPETKKPATSRSKVLVEGRGKELTLRVEAQDTSALRATLNSYLRWVALVKDAYKVTASLENT